MSFTLNGRPIRPNEIGNELMKAAVNSLAEQMRERLSSIRHPETGEFPTVVVTGDSIETLSCRVEGSADLIALVKGRFTGEELDAMTLVEKPSGPPRAFLSFAWDDRPLAKKIAEGLQGNGIDTWWAEWEIRAGDSLIQKINDGLANCTHFIVLLTPNSIARPWVNQEMDAALVRKIHTQSKFIALRHNLPAEALPLLLSGMLSPEIDAEASDLRQLIYDIHGVTRKPALGAAPAATLQPATGYTAAATAVAGVFVSRTTYGLFADPQISIEELSEVTGLSTDDVIDALHELRGIVDVRYEHAVPQDELYATFDQHWMNWHPAEDALRLAADLLNDPSFPHEPAAIAARYTWPPRRLNPAMAYLANRSAVRALKAMGSPFTIFHVSPTDATRRFVRSRR